MATFSIWNLGATDISSYVSVGSTIAFKKDQTLDDGRLVLLLTNDKPLSQKDGFLRYFDGTDNYYFDIVSDSVEPAQRGSENAYAHTVQYASVSRRFAFSLAKGMDFSQPKNGGLAVSRMNQLFLQQYNGETSTQTRVSNYTSGIFLNSKQKAYSGKIKISIYDFANAHTVLERSSFFSMDCSTGSDKSLYLVAYDGSVYHTIASFNGIYADNGEIPLSESDIIGINNHLGMTFSLMFRGIITPEPSQGLSECIINAHLEIGTFYYTYADVINQVIRGCNRPSDNNATETPICQLPVAGDFYNFLTTTISPNFQFTQGETLWECLVKIYDGFDAKPIVTGYSSVPTLGVSYYNERENQIDQSKFVASSSQLQDENRANGVVCRYQNGTTPSPTYFPAKGKSAQARSTTLGVPGNNAYALIVGAPIQSIASMEYTPSKIVMSAPGNLTYTVIPNSDVLMDLAEMLFEQSVYSSLPVSTGFTHYATQRNSMWYKSGENSVYVGTIQNTVDGTTYTYGYAFGLAMLRFFGGTSGNTIGVAPLSDVYTFQKLQISPQDDLLDFPFSALKPYYVRANISYIPQVNGCVRVEGPSDKRFGETLVNQSSALIDLSKMGANMYGLASRLGEEKRSKVYPIDTLANMPKQGSWYKDSDGSLWVVQTAKATIYDDGVKCELELAKNFNQLSRRIAVERQVTFNGIVPSLTLASETIYQEYLYFITKTAFDAGKIPTKTYIRPTSGLFLMACLSSCDTQVDWSSYGVDFAAFSSTTEGVSSNVCHLPIITYGAGNSLCFEGGFDSPISAGNRLKIDVVGWVSTLSSEVVTYADGYGFADYADITLCHSGSIDDYSTLPLIPEPSGGAVLLDNLKIEKRPNDIFKFNYELVFLPYHANGYEDVLIYPNFIKNGQVVTRKKPSSIKLYLLPNGSIPYSNFEAKAYGTAQTPSSYFTVVIYNTSAAGNLYAFYVEMKDGTAAFSVPSGSWIGWMIADENDVPLIASNEILTAGQPIRFYVYGSHNRL